MSEEQNRESVTLPEDVAQNSGARAAKTDADPRVTRAEARNAAAGESPNAAGNTAPSAVEGEIPANSAPDATDVPTAHTPSPDHTRPKAE